MQTRFLNQNSLIELTLASESFSVTEVASSGKQFIFVKIMVEIINFCNEKF